MSEEEKVTYRNLTISVCYDEDSENPREWDNVVTFVCGHKRYDLGDRQDVERCIDELFNEYVHPGDIIDYFVSERGAKFIDGEEEDYSDRFLEYTATYGYGQITRHIDADSSRSDDEIAAEIEDELSKSEKMELIEATGEVVILPISMYEHGGISLWIGSTSGHPDAQWDCSTIGFAYVEKNTAEKEGMLDPGETWNHDWKTWAYDMMEAEMEIYDKYVQGEVYGYMVEDGDGGRASDVLFGHSGFYDKEKMLEEAKADIDAYLQKAQLN